AVENAISENNEEALAALQTAKKRIWIFLELIEDLVWLSRMEAGETPLRKEWVNAYGILLKRIQAVEQQAGQKGITFHLHGDPQVNLLADPLSFEKVADNLFSNAVKYTLPGESRVLVEFKVEGNWFILSVEDEGIGIPAKQQKKLFQEFFRATNAKSVEKFGTGLGLSIVKQVMERHGGRVSLSEGSPKGTRVETRWPFTNASHIP
ncbi:MAG TPA: HAMP domain-containing sensor histidine kinase, partial [bacterium]|nr:HAMP domain-containing sensor histidine kinase [bacterium]